MNIISAIAIYFVTWWICLFVVLPWGVRTQGEAGDVLDGTPESAPVRPNFRRKALITSLVAGVVVLLLELMIRAGVTLDDIPFLPRF